MKRNQRRGPEVPLETQLGELAMRFRGTKDESERDQLASDYKNVVVRLIGGGEWKEMPAFEDMLPDEWMPDAFFKHWLISVPHHSNGR